MPRQAQQPQAQCPRALSGGTRKLAKPVGDSDNRHRVKGGFDASMLRQAQQTQAQPP